MSFLDHLEDLRWHLIRATLAIVIAATIAFLAKGFIFDVLLFGPSQGDFWTYDILCRITNFVGVDGGFCFQELPFTIQSRTMGAIFCSHLGFHHGRFYYRFSLCNLRILEIRSSGDEIQ